MELHLRPLRTHIQGLREAEFPQARALAAPLFHTICLIWSRSSSYSTPARVVVLQRAFCNLLVEQVGGIGSYGRWVTAVTQVSLTQ